MNLTNNQQKIAELHRRHDELGGEIERLEKQISDDSKAEWPKLGDSYLYLFSDGDIGRESFSEKECAVNRLKLGNVFRTENEVRAYAYHLEIKAKVRRKIAELNDGWVPDFKDIESPKRHLIFSHCQNMFIGNVFYDKQHLDTWKIYFHPECARILNDEFTKAELKNALLGEW